MRTKEVEEAIKIVLAVRGTYDSYNDMMFGTGYADKEVQGAIDKVIEYIGELEEKCKSEFKRGVNVKFAEELKGAKKLTIPTPTQYIDKQVIRDKIKEYQDNMKKDEYVDQNIFNANNIRQEVITVLNELIEGE